MIPNRCPGNFLEEYLEEAKKRDLFRLTAPPPEPQAAPELEPESVEVKPPPPPTPFEILAKKAGGLKLVGISAGVTPVAMIEDTVARKTYFLKEGDFLEDIQIVNISEGKALLSYQEAEYVLF